MVRLLHERETKTEFTEDLLAHALHSHTFPPPDRRLIQELVFGITRWRLTLDWLIDAKTGGRTQNAGLRILLRLGLYQMFWLDRIPPHAAVHETVELAKQLGYGRQAGFLNAVLRTYARERDATRKRLDALRLEHPGLGWSHPEWLWERWKGNLGEVQTRDLMAWNNGPASPFARVNELKISPAGLLDRWKVEGVTSIPVSRDWLPPNVAFELTNHPSLPTLPSFTEGLFYVQDPSTLLAVIELDPQANEAVLDLCAAPGGKTTYIAQRMRDKGRVTAQDLRLDRLQLLQQNLSRLGIRSVQTSRADEVVFPELNAQFDRILVDAPCSNTGVIRRRIDVRWRLRPDELPRLAEKQIELLAKAAPLLKTAGTLVYSTCSLEPEENEKAVQTFLAQHGNFRLLRERALLPFLDRVDGAYVAVLTKAQ